MSDNLDLNLNAARADKFFLVFGEIPSLQLLSPDELDLAQSIITEKNDKDYFHMALRTVDLPGVSLGETKIETMLTPLAETDMKFTFDNLVTEVKLDSNYIIYKMILLWIFLTKRPEDFTQYGMKETFKRVTVDATLAVKNNFDDTVLNFEFYELRPLSIPTIPLSYNSEGEDLTMQITWSYSYFMPKTSNGRTFDLDIP
jgi:hypothetical protein